MVHVLFGGTKEEAARGQGPRQSCLKRRKRALMEPEEMIGDTVVVWTTQKLLRGRRRRLCGPIGWTHSNRSDLVRINHLNHKVGR